MHASPKLVVSFLCSNKSQDNCKKQNKTKQNQKKSGSMKFYFITKVVIFFFFGRLLHFTQFRKKVHLVRSLVSRRKIKYAARKDSFAAFIQNDLLKEINYMDKTHVTNSNGLSWKENKNASAREDTLGLTKNKKKTTEMKTVAERKRNENVYIHKRYNVLNSEKNHKLLWNHIFNKSRNAKWYDFKFFSPAKVNLFLRLKEKKETYNELSTLMHSINLGDDIHIKALNNEERLKANEFFKPCATGDFLTIEEKKEIKKCINCVTYANIAKVTKCPNCSKRELKNNIYKEQVATNKENVDSYNNYPLNDKNIIIKLLSEYRKEFQKKDEIRFLIHIKKRIPIFGGLGGGSSNGATIFYFLKNHFYKDLKIDNITSESFLEKIGSDISFFNSSGFAYCVGKGNEVIDLKGQTLSFLKHHKIYLFHINEGLSTPLVFKHVNYKNIIQYNPISLLKEFTHCSDNNAILQIVEEKEKPYKPQFVDLNDTQLQNLIINDLELPSFFLKEKLKVLKSFLIHQNIFEAVGMSGSGTTIFALPKQNITNREIEKKQMQQLIYKLEKELQLMVQINVCEFLRKKEDLWYIPATRSTLIE